MGQFPEASFVYVWLCVSLFRAAPEIMGEGVGRMSEQAAENQAQGVSSLFEYEKTALAMPGFPGTRSSLDQ